MNRYRQDDRFIYDDQFVLPLVQSAIMEYIDECNMENVVQELVDQEPVIDQQFDLPPEESLSDDYKSEGTDIMTLENKIQRALSEGDAHTARQLIQELKSSRVNEGATSAPRGSKSTYKAGQQAIKNMKKAAKEKAAKEKSKTKESKGPHDAEWVNKSERLERKRRLAKKQGDMKKYAELDKEVKKHYAKESMFRDVIAEMLNEGVNMDEAEVVMATQGMADDIQDVVEKVGRMANEDVIAIADKIRNEQGADAAQQFTDTMTQALTSYMEAGRSAKQTIDQVITGLGSGDMAGVMGTGMDPQAGDDLGGELDDLAGGDLGDDDLEMDDNVDAASGPVDEPLGRAELG
jgi:hypothetical protein